MAPRWLRRLVAAAALAAAMRSVPGVAPRVAAQIERADEYRVKAAILYNLAKFVDWPAEVLTTASSPVVVCVLGVDPFGPALDEALKGRLAGGHPLTVRRLTDFAPGCHVLFISASERKRTAVIIDRLGAAPVLTVGDEDGFSAAGGMIELVNAGENVHFNINRAAVDHAGLHMSARLLALAANRVQATGGVR